MLHLLVDTSTWLDLSKKRDGQRWIVALRLLLDEGQLELLVPQVVVDEFERNRDRVETSMTSSIAQRFKLLRQDLDDFGGRESDTALRLLDELSVDVPLIGAMTSRNLHDVLEVLRRGTRIADSANEHTRVIERGLNKRAPLHRGRNSVADALLVELYATRVGGVDLSQEPHAFITSNSLDFSQQHGDSRLPHEDIASLFTPDGSDYRLGVDGLTGALMDHLGPRLTQMMEELHLEEEPRKLAEIMSAEQAYFDRLWYHRSLQSEHNLVATGDQDTLSLLARLAGPARRRIEATYDAPGDLGPYTDFELGLISGKLSALRWVLGSEWDYFDT